MAQLSREDAYLVVFVRHGEATHNAERSSWGERLNSQAKGKQISDEWTYPDNPDLIDPELTEHGMQDATQAGGILQEGLPRLIPDLIVSSSLARCVQTAKLTAEAWAVSRNARHTVRVTDDFRANVGWDENRASHERRSRPEMERFYSDISLEFPDGFPARDRWFDDRHLKGTMVGETDIDHIVRVREAFGEAMELLVANTANSTASTRCGLLIVHNRTVEEM